MTLKRTSRSMPAMPMADSSPPIVVGMRHTSSAISTVADRSVPEYLAIGHRVTQTIRKMMVSPDSRIDSASSFGVFCRSAPSTSAIIRSMKVEPGAEVIFTLMKSDSTVGSAGDGRAVAAGLANDGRGFAGDRQFVDRGDPFDDVAVARDDLAGFDQHDIAQPKIERIHPFDDAAEVFGIDVALGAGVAARAAQGVGLRLAAPLGDGLGEIREQHREPEPGGDLAGKHRRAVVGHEIANEEQGHHQRHRLGDEDDRVLRQGPRVELAQGVDRRGGDDLAVEKALRLCFRSHGSISDQKVLPLSIRKCSTTGPSARAGKYCSR